MGISATSAVYGPHKLAEVKGFFLAQGIDVQVQLMKSDVQAVAMTSGEIEYSGQFPAAARHHAQGLPVKGVAAVVGRSTRWLVSQPEIQSTDDLRGKTVVGTTPAGGDSAALRQVLRHFGREPDRDVQVLYVGDVPARLAALQSRHAEAATFTIGDVLRARELGLRPLVSAADAINIPEDGVTTSERRLAERPDQVKRVLRGMLDAVTYLLREPGESARALADWLDMDERLAVEQMEALRPSLSPDLMVSDAVLQETMKLELAGLGITREVQPSESYDFGLLREVLRERGTDGVLAPAGSS
jgi:NitT/TauT family transport system substrate-binding protein